jgi:hypothetical protein
MRSFPKIPIFVTVEIFLPARYNIFNFQPFNRVSSELLFNLPEFLEGDQNLRDII